MRASPARTLVTAFFALDGFLFANWVVSVPEVKAHVHASAGSLRLALLGISVGALLTMTITGRLCARVGSGRVLVASATLMSIAIILPARAASVAALGAVLFVFGAAFGGLNVAGNSSAVDIIRELGRPIMPSFHAAFSLGGLLGAIVGGAIASQLRTVWQLTTVGVFGLVVTACLGVLLLRSTVRGEAPAGVGAAGTQRAEPSQRLTGGPRWIVAAFGVIALCSAYGEGALADWGALHLRLDLHTSVGLAAAGYASFSAAMVAGRLSGSWLLARLGRTFVLAGGALTAAAGMLIAALVPVLVVVIGGFVLVGLGLANLFPAAIGQAGALRGPRGVAAASTIGYAGLLAGPPTIGFLSERTGLPTALTTISLLAGVAAVVAVLVRRTS